MPAMTCEAVPTKAWLLEAVTSWFFICSFSTTMNFQFCRFPADGASLAASSSFSSLSLGMRSSFISPYASPILDRVKYTHVNLTCGQRVMDYFYNNWYYLITPKVNNTIDICVARLFDKYETEVQARRKINSSKKLIIKEKEISFSMPTNPRILRKFIDRFR